ncbi:VSP with INR [Giardia lamblia P15]|uniref:VSP with INR n=1 Tax=Giardia intestinalis (strain P15) TaxID=658858 RepID=E1EX39_GIAIA|nr:VSP with INR [Giardia lamblia P15]
MFAKLIFISLILQLTEATRPAGRTRSSGACTSLGDAGCATCNPNDGDELCLTCTNEEEFIQLDKKGCTAACAGEGVIGDSVANPKVCKCNEGSGYKPQGGKCVKDSEGECKAENCQECTNKGTANEVCTKCISTHYLTPTNQCVPDCTVIEGYYNDRAANRCEKCNSNCKTCLAADGDKCTSCPAGRALTYEAGDPTRGGTCGDACKVSADGAGCETCGAQIGGTAYCSKCKNTQQAPLDGNCAANARTRFCNTVSNGACTQCADGYFLKDGGCYQTDRQPGKQVCSSAQGGNGKCRTCANGLAASDGNCGECHPTCATCSAAGAAEKCRTCATGYYKENADSSADGTCKRCSEKIPGCKQCTLSSAGSVICLESEAGTGGSTNKSGLSTGAIAGIAVAVVIVVGGLVGFLCWWFLCRGKA